MTITFLIFTQHVTNEVFQGQGETTNVDTPAPLGLFLDEQKTEEKPNALGCRVSKQLDVA